MKNNRRTTSVPPRQLRPEEQLKKTLSFIRSKTRLRPRIAVILGSGLGDFAGMLSRSTSLDVASIPYYPRLTVEGHGGKLVFGHSDNIALLAFQGRAHFYETGLLETVLYPIRVAHALGIRTLLVTNAAGGVNTQFRAGDLMLMKDHINLTFEAPTQQLHGGGRDLYDNRLRTTILEVAEQHDIPLQEGVYCGVKGPSYETAAEIDMVRRIGGDAVGMSTVNEVSLAVAMGMRVCGISCITNLATGITSDKLSHAEVTEVANTVKEQFTTLVRETVRSIGAE